MFKRKKLPEPGMQDNSQKPGRFSKYKSIAWKATRKVLFYTLFSSAVAIGGANLGTYFSYKYHNHNYKKMSNKTKIALQDAVDNNEITKAALKAAQLRVVGAKSPEEAKLEIILITNKGNVEMESTYTMVWNTNKGMEKRDVEKMMIRWRFDQEERKFIPYEAQTRYHYKTVKLPLSGRVPAIVIQNPAHTPGIPGANAQYEESVKVVDVFTLFSAEKWAGSSLLCNLPHEFKSLVIVFKTKIEVVNKVKAKAPNQATN